MLDVTARPTNPDRENEGVWVTIAATPNGYIWWQDGDTPPVAADTPTARIRVARSGNANAKNFRRKALAPHKHVIRQLGEIPSPISEKILNETAAHTLLLDWEDIKADGKKVKYTPDEGLKAFRANEDFRDLVLEIAGTAQLYRDETIAADAETLGNS